MLRSGAQFVAQNRIRKVSLMEAQTPYQSSTPEQMVIQIMRQLPPERVSELVDFARFLEFSATERYRDWIEADNEGQEGSDDADQRWDALFARPEARQLMRQMAKEAREEYHAGRTTEIVETEDERLAPG
jgi:hypothetical protein